MTTADLNPVSFRRPARNGVTALGILGVATALWMATAPLATTLTLSGRVGDDRRQVQIVPADSGRIAEVALSEGQAVARGAVLFRLDSQALQHDLALANSRYDSDRLTRARIEAVLAQADTLVLPADLAAAVTRLPALRLRAGAEQRRFTAALNDRATATASFAVQALQSQATLTALDRQGGAIAGARDLLTAALATRTDLQRRGLASSDATLALQGDMAANAEAAARLQAARAAAIATRDLAALDAQRGQAERIAAVEAELQQVADRLLILSAERAQLTTRIDAMTYRAPVAGTVAELRISGPGDTAITGRPVLRIVPADDRGVIAALVPPDAVAALTIGQQVTIRVVQRNGGEAVQGRIVSLSPTPVSLPPDGGAAFVARIRPALSGGLPAGWMSGTPVVVTVRGQSRPPLALLLEPLVRALRNP